jgi:hypothetical protein
MGARADMLAKQFEEKANELTDAVQKMSDADWKKITTAEKWPVGVTAHHVAGAHEPIVGIAKAVAAGQTLPPFTMQMLDEANAKHAKDFAGCTKAETLELHKKGVASAAAVVKSFSDADLAKSGTVMTGMPAMSVQQIVEGILINHVNDHLGSIKATIGK